ncbi:MAG TPA: tetratricopeptide repeat protein [bacterium]
MALGKIKSLLIPMVAFLLAGCASTSYLSIGRRHLEKEEYDLAIAAFQAAQEEDPENAQIQRELGIAHYQKAEFDKAIPFLLQAFLADTTDGRTLFYLGTAFEITNDLKHAFDIYRRYVEVSPAQGIRKSIEARLTGLIRKQMAEEAKAVLAKESSLNPASFPDSTLAVLYFKNIGKKRDLDPVQKGLADMLITDLSKVARLKVVERVRMQKMLDEIGLGQTGLVDVATAPRVGKLLGASRLVNGTFIDLSQEALRIDAGFVLTKKTKSLSPSQVQGNLSQFFRMEKELAFGILDKLGIRLTQTERDAIQIIPTENLLAFLAYCNGLDYEDKGMYKQAQQQYQRAAQLDPNFEQAVQAVSRSEDLVLSEIPLGQLENMFSGTASETETAAVPTQGQQNQEEIEEQTQERPPQEQITETSAERVERQPVSDIETPLTPEGSEPATPLIDQMLHTAGVLDQGFLPGLDSRNTTQEENQSSFGNAANFLVRVHLPQQ